MSVNSIEWPPKRLYEPVPLPTAEDVLARAERMRQLLIRKLDTMDPSAAIHIEGDPCQYPVCTVRELVDAIEPILPAGTPRVGREQFRNAFRVDPKCPDDYVYLVPPEGFTFDEPEPVTGNIEFGEKKKFL